MLNEIAQCTSKSPRVQSCSILIEHKYIMINNYENKNIRCDKAAQMCGFFWNTENIALSKNVNASILIIHSDLLFLFLYKKTVWTKIRNR